MAKRIWVALFIMFGIYTGVVYSYCDAHKQPAPDKQVKQGWALWQSKNCQSCHQLYGLGGYLGPDLTNTCSMKGSVYMKGIIKHGTGRMPDMQLTDEEINSIIAFLGWVDKTGRSVVKKEQVHWSGTYVMEE